MSDLARFLRPVAFFSLVLVGANVHAQVPPQYVDALRGADYTIYSADINGDSTTDLLLRAARRIVVIDFDISIPVVLKPKSPTFALISNGSGYILDSAPSASTLNNPAWVAGGYDLVFGDFLGAGAGGMVIRAQSGGRASFSITTSTANGAPQLVQALTSQSIGVDLSANGVTTELSDQNSDGRADLVVRKSGLIDTVLTADANGIFSRNNDATLRAIWLAMIDSLAAGNTSVAEQYISSDSLPVYEQAFANMGSLVTDVKATLSNFQLVEVRDHFARYLVDQTIDGVTRMHFVEFIENDGRWSLASF